MLERPRSLETAATAIPATRFNVESVEHRSLSSLSETLEDKKTGGLQAQESHLSRTHRGRENLRSCGAPIGIYGGERRDPRGQRGLHTGRVYKDSGTTPSSFTDFVKNMTTGALQADTTLVTGVVCHCLLKPGCPERSQRARRDVAKCSDKEKLVEDDCSRRCKKSLVQSVVESVVRQSVERVV